MLGLPFIIKFNKTIKNLLHALIRSDQVSNSEMISSRHLTKARPRNSHDSSLFNHVHAVDVVRWLSFSSALGNEFIWEVKSWEPVHSSLNIGASNILHVLKAVGQHLSFLFKRFLDSSRLLVIEVDALVRFTAALGRVDHKFNSHLARRVWAKLNRLQFVESGFSLLAQVS